MILAAAKRVFADKGYEAATVSDIIRGTDLASGTFYNYFRSKDEIASAISHEIRGTLAASAHADDAHSAEPAAAHARRGRSHPRPAAGGGLNGLLNYGYAILRAATSRA